METTNDGFTFRRVSTNKVEHVEMKCKSAEPRISRADAFEMEGFTFRKVRSGGKPTIELRAGRDGNVGGWGAGAKGSELTSKKMHSGVQPGHNGLITAGSGIRSNFNPSVVPKKRRTIHMEECLDLSTDSVGAEVLAMPAQERIRSSEIHKRVGDGNINTLVRECIAFLRDNSSYAREISSYCKNNYFSDVDYRRDIENTQLRIDAVQNEICKWNRVHEECNAKIEVRLPAEQPAPPGHAFDPSSILGEFQAKAERLKELEGRLAYFLEGAKTRSETVLKSIFGAVENRTVDTLFLLKAMSKLGK